MVQISAQTEEGTSIQVSQVTAAEEIGVQTASRPVEPTKEFMISNENNFTEFMTEPEYWGNNYKVTLVCDIDMKDKAFNPIKEFGGVFDGCGHTVSNFKVQDKLSKSKNSELAFINTLNEFAEIKNITFDNYRVQGKSGIKKAAGLIVTNHGTVSFVDIINSSINNIDKKVKSAGFVLNNEKDGVIENCHMENMSAKDSNIRSGLVGTNYGKITNCSTTLSVNNKDLAGGFVSENFGTIEKCDSKGDVESKKCSGGFCGKNSGDIIFCKSENNVTAKTKSTKVATICGGFVGEDNGNIKKCSSTGAVEGQEFTGGFVGINNDEGEIISCKSTCDVKSHTYVASIYCGGFAGLGAGKIENCTFDGKVDGCVDSEKVVGIAVGAVIGTIVLITVICLLVKYFKDRPILEEKAEEIKNNALGYANQTKDAYEKARDDYNKARDDYNKARDDYSKVNDDYKKARSDFETIDNYYDEIYIKGGKKEGACSCSRKVGKACDDYEKAEDALNKAHDDYEKAEDALNKAHDDYEKAEDALNKAHDDYEKANYANNKAYDAYSAVENINNVVTKLFFKDSFVISLLVGAFIGGGALAIASGLATRFTAGSKCANVAGFCGLNMGEITKCNANNDSINAKSMHNKYNMCGGFVGTNGGTIKDSDATGKEICNETYTGGNLGGFVGDNIGKIENGTTTVSVTNGKYTGGFCGNNSGEIVSSKSEGSAIANATTVETKCGGFVGNNEKGNIDSCTSTGNAIGEEYVGGFAGVNKSDIIDCYAHGKATAKTKTHTALAGGFVGENEKGTIISCEATGGAHSQSSSGQAKAGGFVGVNKASIIGSRASGNVYLSAGTCHTDDGCGGFVGKNDKDGSIDGCYAECIVETTNKKKGGGFVGEAKNNSTIINSKCKSKIVTKAGTKINTKFCENKDKKSVITN